VGKRNTYDTIYQIGGYTTNSFFGTSLQVIESDDGYQLQLFSVKYNPTYALSYIDIIYNPVLSTDYQYIKLYTYFFEQLIPQAGNSTFSNSTLLSLAAHNGYMLMYQQD